MWGIRFQTYVTLSFGESVHFDIGSAQSFLYVIHYTSLLI